MKHAAVYGAMAVLGICAPIAAEVPMVEEHVFDTRFGQVQVVGGEVDQRLWFAGDFLDGPDDDRYWIRASAGLEGEAFDWVVVTSHHMGNMCGGYSAYYVPQVGPDVARVSPPLDACLGVLDLRAVPGGVELDLFHHDLTISHETFTWDGVTLTSELVPDAPAEPAGAGADVTRWIGQDSTQIFLDAAERARLETIMSPDQVQALAASMSFGNTIERRGDWVLAQSCQRHNCGFSRGIWAVRISDGAVAAATLYGDPLVMEGFGVVDDPVVAAAIAEQSR